MALLRAESQRAGIPYWNFFNTMPYGPQTDPTEAQIRWQIFATVAHGARGVLWFCYYTPRGGEFPKGGAIIGSDDQPTIHYEHARRINGELKNLGPTLMQLTSTRVLHLEPPERRGRSSGRGGNEARAEGGATVMERTATLATKVTTGTGTFVSSAVTTEPLVSGPIRRIAADIAPDLLIGEFRHADGRRAVLIQNYDITYSTWLTVEFDGDAGRVMEVDKATGAARAVRDASPDMTGLQVGLQPGDGRLFLVP